MSWRDDFGLGDRSPMCIAFDYLVAKGLSDFQAAGVVGNLQQESSMNTHAVGDNGTSFGIAQWHNQRWTNAKAFASQTGRDVYALDVQLDFLWRELQTSEKASLVALNATTTLEDATVAFQDKFERCGACATSARIAFAKKTLSACGGRVVAPVSTRSVLAPAFAVGVLLGVGAAVAYTWK